MGAKVVSAGSARFRLTRIVLAVGVAAALASGAGSLPARATGTATVSAAGSDQPAAWAQTASYPVLGSFALAVDPTTHTVYFAGTATGLSALNELTGKMTGNIDPGDDEIAAAAVNPGTGTLYISTGQSVKAVNLSSGKVTATIPDGQSPRAIVVNPDTDTIYVANTSTITVIDGSTNTVTTTIDLAQGMSGMAVDPVTNTLYVSNFRTGTVSVIDGATNDVTTTVAGLDPDPGQIAVNTATGKIYVADDGSIAVVSAKTNSLVTTIDADVSQLAVDQETNTIYTLDEGSELGAINGATNEFELNFIPPGDSGNTIGGGLAVDPTAGTVYVITIFSNPGDPDSFAMEAIASCGSHIIAPAGSSCAKVAADFLPQSATFSSPSQGVVLGSSCCGQVAMMATADGGKQWSFIGPPPGLDLESFQPPAGNALFTSAGSGWVYGGWHTANGGASWQRAVPGAIELVLAMAASKTTVYEAAQPDQGRGELFAAPVGGTGWTRVPGITGDATGLATSGRSVWVTSSTRFWASADGRVWHSYPARCPGTGYQLAGVTATSPSDVALLCERPAGSGSARRKELLISTDGGRTVHLVGPAPSRGVAQAFASPPGDPSVITLAAGGTAKNSSYRIYRSADGGKTWTTRVIKGIAGESFRSLSYQNRTAGWVVLASSRPGTSNVLLHTADGGRTWSKVTP